MFDTISLPARNTIEKDEANIGGPEEPSEDNTAPLSLDAVQNEDDNQVAFGCLFA